MSEQNAINKQTNSLKSERQLELLKRKIQELTTENQILREINVKLQIENYNLQKKLDSKQLEEELIIDEPSEIEKTESNYPEKNEELFEVVYDNDAINTEEYLDQDEAVYEVQEEEILKHSQEESVEDEHNSSNKRRYSEVYDEKVVVEDPPIVKMPKNDSVNYQITILDRSLNGSIESIILEEEVESIELENVNDNPKDSMLYIYKLAGKNNTLDKLKSIEKGKHKDSAFVSKVLDLLFDRVTLANSTAQGQKCQSKLHLPAKPALDQSKMDVCLKAFLYRLQQEDINENEEQSRIKSFNKLVNDKIQNCRKCLTRIDSSKLLEA